MGTGYSVTTKSSTCPRATRAREFFCQSTMGSQQGQAYATQWPFALAIDQQDRIWITNAIGDTVTRFPASDPSKVEVFPTGGGSGKGMAIDSRGNAWVTNTMGSGMTLETKLRLLVLNCVGSTLSDRSSRATRFNFSSGLGKRVDVRPDGSPVPGSPFNPGSIWGAWAVSIDGNDHAWISNFAPGGGIAERLCGARTETCPAGMKTGDPIFSARRIQGWWDAVVGRCLHRSRR